jgi:hypothetical protein
LGRRPASGAAAEREAGAARKRTRERKRSIPSD